MTHLLELLEFLDVKTDLVESLVAGVLNAQIDHRVGEGATYVMRTCGVISKHLSVILSSLIWTYLELIHITVSCPLGQTVRKYVLFKFLFSAGRSPTVLDKYLRCDAQCV